MVLQSMRLRLERWLAKIQKIVKILNRRSSAGHLDCGGFFGGCLTKDDETFVFSVSCSPAIASQFKTGASR